MRAGDLLLAIDRGSMCASPKVEHPEYLSSALLELTPSGLNIVSTDKRRLAVSRIDTDTAGEEASLLLPLSSLRDLQKIMHSLPDDTEVNITHDSGQAYFDTAADIEFAVREVSSKFPPYQRLLGGKTVGVIEVGKADLASAIERVDVVVRDSNKVVYVKRGKDSSELILFGQSPEFGEAIEHIPATFSGESIMGAFNTRFFMEALKAMDADVVSLSSGDSNGHMVINAINSDATKCMIAPTEASNDEINNLYESIIAQDPAV